MSTEGEFIEFLELLVCHLSVSLLDIVYRFGSKMPTEFRMILDFLEKALVKACRRRCLSPSTVHPARAAFSPGFRRLRGPSVRELRLFFQEEIPVEVL